MRMPLRSVMVLATIVVVTLGGARIVAAGPQAVQAAEPMTALLAEVHALRLALEHSATIAPRVQLSLARLNIEEQRIGQLAAQLDQVRRELSAAVLESQKLSDQLPDVEKGIQTAPDDKARRSYEYEHADVKRKLAAQSRLEEQFRARENEIAQALSTEQARWIDLNARLDELERLLGPAPR